MHVDSAKSYIRKYQPHCDKYLTDLIDPAGKSVLVLGSGWGSEMLWAVRHGASRVTGVDPADRNDRAIKEVMAEEGLDIPVSILRTTTIDLEAEPFDIVVSNNVVEHVHALKATLRSMRRLLVPGGPIAIFSDPLWYSSMGSHMPLRAWEHLTAPESEIRAQLNLYQWREINHAMNEMTITDFLQAVREAGLILQRFEIIPDRNLKHLASVIPALRTSAYPMDLALEGLKAVLRFPV